MRAIIFTVLLLLILVTMLVGCQDMIPPPDDGKCHCGSPVCVQNGGRKPLLHKCGCSDAACICGVKKK
jgi:hypothetical protein